MSRNSRRLTRDDATEIRRPAQTSGRAASPRVEHHPRDHADRDCRAGPERAGARLAIPAPRLAPAVGPCVSSSLRTCSFPRTRSRARGDRSRPTPLAAAAERLRGRPGRPRKAAAESPLVSAVIGAAARLVDVDGAARYLGGISPWSVRDLHASGRLPRVRLPLGGDRELRRLLFDVRDLDRLVDASKEGPA